MAGIGRLVEASPCCKVSSLGVKEAAVALSLAAHGFFLGRLFFLIFDSNTFFLVRGWVCNPGKSF